MPSSRLEKEMPNKSEPKKVADLQYRRTDDFVKSYANNAYYESSAWDLTIVFGQLDQVVGSPAIIRQNIAITIPWAQAKLLSYFVRLHVEANEVQNGKVSIRPDLLPPVPPALTGEEAKDPNAQKLFELATKLREELIANS
jgi:hypothetical protein